MTANSNRMSALHFEVRVPATSANLGAGYDLIGAALNCYNQFFFRLVAPETALCIRTSGRFGDAVSFPLDQNNTVWQAFASVFQARGLTPPPVEIELGVNIPPARGLGSSSTAIVAGLLAANACLEQPFSKTEILQQAIAWEGHPDNVAPALLGGCVLSLETADGFQSFVLEVPDDLNWVICFPDFELETKKAREVVPQSLNREDCVRNTSYLAALVAGLAQNNDQLLALGLNDCLHQPYRQILVPGMSDVMQAAKAAGALGSVLSGAGPSLLALCRQNAPEIAAAMQAAWNKQGISCDYVIATIDTQGAVVIY
jgi:homoserine kinase